VSSATSRSRGSATRHRKRRPYRRWRPRSDMELANTLRIALTALRRNAVRSALTALGVIIGVASVIAMIALSSGARASIDEQIQSQGTNVIYVSSGSFGGRGTARG